MTGAENRQAFSYKHRAEFWEGEAAKAIRLSQESTAKGNYIAAHEYDRIAEAAQKQARSERKSWADMIILSMIATAQAHAVDTTEYEELRTYCLGKL